MKITVKNQIRKVFLIFNTKIGQKSEISQTSEDNYNDDDFVDEEALGIEVIDDSENDDEYADEDFEKAFEVAEPIRRNNTGSGNRPISKKYVQTPGSSRRMDSSKINAKYKIEEKEDKEESELEKGLPDRIEEEPGVENAKESIQNSSVKEKQKIDKTQKKEISVKENKVKKTQKFEKIENKQQEKRNEVRQPKEKIIKPKINRKQK